MRRLVIGDIHGCLGALKYVLNEAKYDAANDKVICVGDYIDTGNQSYEVVEFLLDLQSKAVHKPIFILGNHDEYWRKIFSNNLSKVRDERFMSRHYDDWINEWEGAATYYDYMKRSDADILRHKSEFYDKLLCYYVEDNKLYVHAGYDPKLGLKQTITLHGEKDLIWKRDLYNAANDYWQREKNGENVSNLNSIFDGFERIFIGHTPTCKIGINEPTKMGRLINVDQGCKVNGTLTLWIEESESYYQFVSSAI